MDKRLFFLHLTVLVTGAEVMILELTGSRILAPLAGTTLQVWTSLIGIILASLSLGYIFGGRLADNNPNIKVITYILFAAGISIGLIPVLNTLVNSTLAFYIHDIRVLAILATIFLFSIPSILLGMVSPYIIRLKIKNVTTSGSVSGSIYALSTIGSILGTFLSGFFLIAYLGSTQILYLLAFVLFLLSLVLFSQKLSLEKAGIVMLSLMVIIILDGYTILIKRNNEVDLDTEYNRVTIYDYLDSSGQFARQLRLGNQYSSAMYLNSNELVYDYTKYYRLADYFNPNIRRALMIGGAAYSYPKDFLSKHPKAHLDVVEIDPELTVLAQKYFRLRLGSQITVHTEDGRTFLNFSSKKYDAIYNDAFGTSYSIPFQLTTSEAVKKMYNLLSQNGVVIANIISSISGEKGKFFKAEYKTYKSVFPYVYIFPVQYPNDDSLVQNIILLALKNKELVIRDKNLAYAQYFSHIRTGKLQLDLPVLTDNFAPVENYTQNLYTYY